jgi:hypothetical protein
MATPKKVIASGAVNGIVTLTSVATGTTIHTCTATANEADQLAIFVGNPSTTATTVTLFAGTTPFAKKAISALNGQDDVFVYSSGDGVVVYGCGDATGLLQVVADINRLASE